MPIFNAGAEASTPQVVTTTLGTSNNNFGTPGLEQLNRSIVMK
jgi:hypothetical protein